MNTGVAVSALPDRLDPDTVHFTLPLLGHAERVGITLDQMRSALDRPRLVNRVRRPDLDPDRPRLRFCGAGVAVITEGRRAIAVIEDDPSRHPSNRT